MKKYKCIAHKTVLKVDDNGNRSIDIPLQGLGCHLPGMEKLKEQEIGDCVIKEVSPNGASNRER